VVKAKDIEIIKELGKENIEEIEKIFKMPNSTIYKIRFSQDVDITTMANKYMANPHIEYAHPNYILKSCIIPNDKYFNEQWALDKMQASVAWDIEKGTSAVIIAIPDTGVDLDHPDLTTNLWVNDDDSVDGVDNDNNGYVDDIRGWDFVNLDNDPRDDNGHGSTIAGIIAAVPDNTEGIAGVCWYCKIMPIKCLDNKGRGNVVDISRAIEYAVDNGAKVINMSFGSYDDIPLLKEAIDYAYHQGCVLVAAAGNDNTTSKFYPAGYGSVTSVCAVDNDARKLSFSNYGNWIDVSAAGNDILTTSWNNSYVCVDGTSVASGFVSGLAGLILSQHPDWSNAQVYQKIMATTDNIDNVNPGYEGLLGSGRINLYNALVSARIEVSPTSGTIGSIVTVRGEGFRPTETITINFGKTLNIVTPRADNSGKFQVSFTVDTQPMGLTTVVALGMVSQCKAMAYFLILPSTVTSLLNGNESKINKLKEQKNITV